MRTPRAERTSGSIRQPSHAPAEQSPRRQAVWVFVGVAAAFAVLVIACAGLLILGFWYGRANSNGPGSAPAAVGGGAPINAQAPAGAATRDSEPVSAHVLHAAWSDYRRFEDHTRRGPRFEQLASRWSAHQRSGVEVRAKVLLKEFGPPDYVLLEGEQERYLFLYERDGRKDWLVSCSAETGVVTQIGFSRVSAVNLDDFELFR